MNGARNWEVQSGFRRSTTEETGPSFFVDLEWIKQNANGIEQYTVPTESERKGNLSDVLASTTGNALTLYDPL